MGIRTVLILLTLMACTGCLTPGLDFSLSQDPEPEYKASESPGQGTSLTPVPNKEEENLPTQKVRDKGPTGYKPPYQRAPQQQLLDSALAYCQRSQESWENGDFEESISALDKAYSLILKVSPGEDPEILQQKEDLRFTISKRILECYSARFKAVNGNHNAIPFVMNKYVQKALDYFKGPNREFFLESYKRSGRYRPYILRKLKEAGLPEELSWLPLVESGFKVQAMSKARALGLWQFIASTGYKYGLERNRWIDERLDPQKSTRAAIAYLKELHNIFGDWSTVLAAYNCGPGTVLRCIRRQKINYLDNFWDLYQKLPVETAFYVPKFIAVLHIVNNPQAHGFTLPEVDREIKIEEVTIDKQVHLKTIAKHLDISYGLLKDINPELRRNYTPKEPYTLRVPAGKGEELLAELEDLPLWRPPVPAYVVHRVRRGESLSVIASKYHTTTRAIMRMNRLSNPHYVKAGWKLKVPTKMAFSSLSNSRPMAQSQELKGKLMEYTVQRGDSLWKIARRFGTTINTIRSLNQLSGTYLRVGQVLLVPKRPLSLSTIKTRPYKVKKGDSPYLIARRHRMDLDDFLRLNNLTPSTTIYPGQILSVPAH